MGKQKNKDMSKFGGIFSIQLLVFFLRFFLSQGSQCKGLETVQELGISLGNRLSCCNKETSKYSGPNVFKFNFFLINRGHSQRQEVAEQLCSVKLSFSTSCSFSRPAQSPSLGGPGSLLSTRITCSQFSSADTVLTASQGWITLQVRKLYLSHQTGNPLRSRVMSS